MVKQFGLFKCLERFGHLKCWMSSRINILSVSSRLGISSVGCLAEWTFQVLGVKQIGRFKRWMSSSLGISCIGGRADWVFQDLKSRSLGVSCFGVKTN